MSEDVNIPDMPGYIPIKQAAEIMGISVSRVYDYVEEGRLPAVKAAHVIMIAGKDVRAFKPGLSGRPRKSVPLWRKSPDDNLLLMTTIVVQARPGQEAALVESLDEIRKADAYI